MSQASPFAQPLHATPTRIVLDTNVVLDWLWFVDPATRWLQEGFAQGQLSLITDAACSAGLLDVLSRPSLRADVCAREQIQHRYLTLANPVPADATAQAIEALPQCKDRSDQKFIELPVRGSADVLVTRDRALLTLSARLYAQRRIMIADPRQAARWLAEPAHPA